MAVFADPLDLLGAMNPVPDERALPATSAYVPAQRTLQRILAQSLPLAPTAPAPDPPRTAAAKAAAGGAGRRSAWWWGSPWRPSASSRRPRRGW